MEIGLFQAEVTNVTCHVMSRVRDVTEDCTTPIKHAPLGVLCVQRSSHSPPTPLSPGTPKTHLARCVLGVRLLLVPLPATHNPSRPSLPSLSHPLPFVLFPFLAISFLVIHLYYNICILLLLN